MAMREGPWMIELYRRCERCRGEGSVPDVVIENSVQSETTLGGRCPACNGAGYVDRKLVPAEGLDAFLAADRALPENDETD
jgi:hypothetical protein